jgi:hypothetical protein
VVALRRRAEFGNQRPMLLAGGVSVIAGFTYVTAAATADWLCPECSQERGLP